MAFGVDHGLLFRSNDDGMSRDWWNVFGSSCARFCKSTGVRTDEFDMLHMHRWLVRLGVAQPHSWVTY